MSVKQIIEGIIVLLICIIPRYEEKEIEKQKENDKKQKNELLESGMNNPNEEKNQNDDSKEDLLKTTFKNEKLEYLNSVAQFKKQREEKIKILKDLGLELIDMEKNLRKWLELIL